MMLWGTGYLVSLVEFAELCGKVSSASGANELIRYSTEEPYSIPGEHVESNIEIISFPSAHFPERTAVTQNFTPAPELLCDIKTRFRFSLLHQVLRANSSVGEGCPQKLETANLLRFLLLVLIPCICALIVLLAILLSFVGTLNKVYLKSNGSEPVVTDGEVQVPGIFFVNTVYNESTGAPTISPDRSTPAWTPKAPPLDGDQSHRNESACMNITHSQCQILPYHSTLAPILPIVKNMDMEKFLKFFTYLHRLSCYQHILLFGCSLAFPECIVDGDDRRGLLPCRSFCEAAKEGCESVLGMVNFSWPDSLRCSQFTDHTENSSNVSKICFSLQQEHGKQ
ncbi:atrial natriuretic peptide-converting enzyme isoform X1, partial [Cricetulus griseus]|uniref:atrial natriuretic peptide-converting enzyme isoform X1 n=1 Tax=Cricetulus griseus TaxID=10029 RepID=UPI00045446C0